MWDYGDWQTIEISCQQDVEETKIAPPSTVTLFHFVIVINCLDYHTVVKKKRQMVKYEQFLKHTTQKEPSYVKLGDPNLSYLGMLILE